MRKPLEKKIGEHLRVGCLMRHYPRELHYATVAVGRSVHSTVVSLTPTELSDLIERLEQIRQWIHQETHLDSATDEKPFRQSVAKYEVHINQVGRLYEAQVFKNNRPQPVHKPWGFLSARAAVKQVGSYFLKVAFDSSKKTANKKTPDIMPVLDILEGLISWSFSRNLNGEFIAIQDAERHAIRVLVEEGRMRVVEDSDERLVADWVEEDA